MSLNHPKSGPNNVGAYQVSGIPFVTGSTGSPETIAAAEELRVSFSAEGAIGGPGQDEKYAFLCPVNNAVTLDVRCKTIFVTTSADMEWSLCAGLTPIRAADFPVLTGSNGFAGVGGAAL